jgi:electron transfer flavoprotein alpha/beta subunit
MNVLVCLRTTARTTPDLLDGADARALAHAVRLRSAGHRLTALYAASAADAANVAARLAPHVDRAVHVVSDELAAADFHTCGQMLAMTIRRIGADLVLAPIQGEDEAASGTPAAIARHLGAHYVPFVEEITVLDDAGAEVVVRGGGRKRRLRVAFPAVLGTAPGAAALPQPAAQSGAAPPPVENMGLTDPDATVVRRRTELLGRPEPASRGTQTVTSAAALIAALKRA